MRRLFVAAAMAFVIFGAFAYGVIVGRYQTPPYRLLRAGKQMVFPPAQASSTRNGSYKRRLTHFRALPQPPDVVMVGDSITSEAEWGEMLPDIAIGNRGIHGDTSIGVLDRLDELLDASPQIVFVMIGVNDLDQGVPVRLVVANTRAILRRIRASGATPIFQPMLLVGANRTDQLNVRVELVNDAVRRFCQHADIPVLDLNPTFAPHGHLEPQHSTDGVHLTGDAYAIWAEAVRQQIEQTRVGQAKRQPSGSGG